MEGATLSAGRCSPHVIVMANASSGTLPTPTTRQVINLGHEHYNELIEVEHPDAVVALLIQSPMNDTRVNLPGS